MDEHFIKVEALLQTLAEAHSPLMQPATTTINLQGVVAGNTERKGKGIQILPDSGVNDRGRVSGESGPSRGVGFSGFGELVCGEFGLAEGKLIACDIGQLMGDCSSAFSTRGVGRRGGLALDIPNARPVRMGLYFGFSVLGLGGYGEGEPW